MGDAPPQDVQQLIHSHGGGLDQFHQGGQLAVFGPIPGKSLAVLPVHNLL